MSFKTIEDYHIVIQCYDWSKIPNIDPLDVSFFAENEPEIIGEIDLHDYGIEASEIDINRLGTIRQEGLIYSEYQEADDIRFRLSGIAKDGYLRGFFKIFEDTTYYAWLLKISEDDRRDPFFTGFIHPDTISEQFDGTSESDIVDIMAIDLRWKFRDYYSKKTLKDPAEIVWPAQLNIPAGSIAPPTIHIKPLKDILRDDVFTSDFIDIYVEPDIEQWKVARECVMYRTDAAPEVNEIGEHQTANGDFFSRGATQRAKNQVLYLASELQAAMLTPGRIHDIAFWTRNEVGSNYATELKISVKHTNLTALTDFESSGFTQVFFSPQHVFEPHGGTSQNWEIFHLDENTPFDWNGTDNLIIEVCYLFKTANPQVYVYTHPESGKWINAKTSNVLGGCSQTTGNVMNARPALGISIGEAVPVRDIFIKNSYTRAFREDESCYDWLERIAAGMGWILTMENRTFVIKNRVTVDTGTQEIDSDKFIKWKVHHSLTGVTFNTIIIMDGEYTAGKNVNPWGAVEPNGQNVLDAINGKRMVILSSVYPELRQMSGNWWTKITGTTEQRYALTSPVFGYKFLKQFEDKERFITYKIYGWDDNNYLYTDLKREVKKNRILVIDAGENTSKRYKINCIDGSASESESGTPGDFDFIFSSNYCNALITVDGGNFLNMTYAEYVKTQPFINNFLPLTYGIQNIAVSAEMVGVLTDARIKRTIANNPDLTGEWQTSRMRIKLMEGTTEIELTKHSSPLFRG